MVLHMWMLLTLELRIGEGNQARSRILIRVLSEEEWLQGQQMTATVRDSELYSVVMQGAKLGVLEKEEGKILWKEQ